MANPAVPPPTFAAEARTAPATSKDVAAAAFNVGCCYRDGTGGATKDLKDAAVWFRKAAKAGHVDAMVSLGVRHMLGQGVAATPEEGVKWFKKAADLGSAAAMNNLGSAYRDGAGVVKDNPKAIEWYNKAAEKGSVEAKINLAWAHERGLGVTVAVDKAAALKYYQEAADKGSTFAAKAVARLTAVPSVRIKATGPAAASDASAAAAAARTSAGIEPAVAPASATAEPEHHVEGEAAETFDPTDLMSEDGELIAPNKDLKELLQSVDRRIEELMAMQIAEGHE